MLDSGSGTIRKYGLVGLGVVLLEEVGWPPETAAAVERSQSVEDRAGEVTQALFRITQKIISHQPCLAPRGQIFSFNT